MTGSRRRAGRGRARARTRVLRALLVGVLAVVVGLASFVGGLLAAPVDFALPAPPTSVTLLAADGRPFASIPPPEQRVEVPAADIPQVMRDAIIAAEDERFLRHRGVDPLATLRAAFRDLTGSTTQGGSTLTQQYVKNAYVGNERTALRKVREAALAVRLEQQLGKQQILTDYLNALYLGNGLYGVQAASAYYFGVPVKDLALDARTGKRSDGLALARASLLAGTAPAPSVWNPVADFATARARQTYTLNRMVAGGSTTAQQATAAFRLDVHPLRISPKVPGTVAPEFADAVTHRLMADPSYDPARFFRGGPQVRTTLDLDLQAAATGALRDVLPDSTDPEAAVVAVDYRNGDVRALSTLRRVPARVDNATGKVVAAAASGYTRDGFDLGTDGLRSTGSTIKPFTYAQALLEGLTPDTVRPGPEELKIPNPGSPPYLLHNAEPGSGSYTLREALAQSVNTVYVPLANDVGRAKVRALAVKAGLGPASSITAAFPSFGVGGGVDVTPLSEAVAYGAFAAGGLHVAPRMWTEIRSGGSASTPGAVVARQPVTGQVRVLPEAVAGQVVDALTDVVASGTGTAAQQPFPVFGKTGTTNDAKDAWFTGCIPTQHVCLAVWMGYDASTCRNERTHVVGRACGSMHDLHGVKGLVFGGTLPARVFARTQERLRAAQAARDGATASPAPSPSSDPTTAPPAAFVPLPTARPRRTRRALLPSAAPSPPPASSPPPAPSTTAAPSPAPSPAPSRIPAPSASATPAPGGVPSTGPPQ